MPNSKRVLQPTAAQLSLQNQLETLEIDLANLIKLYGPKHDQVIQVNAKMAMLYNKLGDYHKAVKIMTMAMQEWQTRYAEDSPKLVINRVVLACMLQDVGRYQEAITLLETSQSMIEMDNYFPPPLLLHTKWNLARVYQDAGDQYSAAMLYEQLVQSVEGASDGTNPASYRVDLAIAYRKTGRCQMAVAVLGKMLKEEQQAKHPQQRLILEAKKELVLNYLELECYAEAAASAEEVLRMEAVDKGANHLDLVITLKYQVLCYQQLEEAEKVRSKLQHMLQLYLRHHGAGHEATKAVQRQLDHWA